MASNQLVPTLATKLTPQLYVQAVVDAWSLVEEGIPSKASIGVLWAQYMVETGNRACWNWNIGNVKKVAGDGYDYQYLNGVWEGFNPAEAARLIANGEAVADPSADHAKAVGPGRVSIIFKPPHPQTRFRAFASLNESMRDHVRFLKKRYADGWTKGVLVGDCDQFAVYLKAKGYFSAEASAYANGMRPAFKAFMGSTAYEDVMGLSDPSVTPPKLTLADFEDVAQWQRELIAQGFELGSADGVLGPKTKNAIQQFQLAHDLTPDGVVGPKTKQALLDEALKREE